MGRKMRTLLSVVILLGTIGWIVLSYIPSGLVSLPQFTYSADDVVRFFPGLIVAGFVVFLVLQTWIVQSTGASIRRYEEASQGQAASGFRLTVGREVLLTALPIAFTVAVAIASYGWWLRVIALNQGQG